MALGADVIFLGLDVVAAGDIIKAVKVAKVANTEAKAAKKVAEQAVIIPGISEPPVRTLRATIPENERHIFR